MGTYLAQPLTQKKSYTETTGNLKAAVCQMQGWRRQMEDATITEVDLCDGNSLFAVFDGHGGPEVSNYVKSIFTQTLLNSYFYQKGQYDTAMIETFKKIDERLRNDEVEQDLKELSNLRKDKTSLRYLKNRRISEIAGCAAHVLLITPLVYVVANCGDSRSFLCRNGKAIPMSDDHKPNEPVERQRIQSAGGKIISGRINGGLNLSRGFGDYLYKNQQLNFDQRIVTCMPEVRFFARSPQDQYIFLGCDGIFQKFYDNVQPLANIISKRRRSQVRGEVVLSELFNSIIANQMSEQYGCDNMSSILIQFL